ncbi:MAG: low molecular weight phosphatase family protein [Hyphomicrobiaceae bacterium]
MSTCRRWRRKAITSVLFICTGNIFRSMTAEYALRGVAPLAVSSAGLIDAPHEVLPFVRSHLTGKGVDIAEHQPRRLTQAILDDADVAVAMGTDHRDHVGEVHGRDIPLFSEVAFGKSEPLRDVWEVIPDWRNNDAEAHAYAWSLMDRIFDGMPQFVARMEDFVRS